VTALVAAVGTERYLEPRLTGGFPSGPVRSANRGQGELSSQNLALLAAIGEAQRRVQAEPTAANLHAWGVGQVLLGSYDEAIESFESAAIESPAPDVKVKGVHLIAGCCARAGETIMTVDITRAMYRIDSTPYEVGPRVAAGEVGEQRS